MSATENIVRDDLALGVRLRVAELADVQAMHRMETTLFPADAWHIDMFLEELTHPTRTYYMLELPAEGSESSEGGWRAIGYCGYRRRSNHRRAPRVRGSRLRSRHA